jgi:hypothetical protein
MQMSEVLVVEQRCDIHVVRTRPGEEVNIRKQQKGTDPNVGAQKAVEYVARLRTIVIMSERHPATQRLVNQNGEVVPEYGLIRIEALYVYRRVGEVIKPLSEAREEFEFDVAVTCGMLA